MEIILTVLKDSASLTAKLLLIIMPLSIAYEFLKKRQQNMGRKKLSIMGITGDGLVPLVTGIIIGLTYGAGVIIHSIRAYNIRKKEAFLILLFLSVCHAIIEDTLIFVVIGANGLILIAARFFLAIIITYAVHRSGLFRSEP
jgi:hypothetical protein